MPDHVLTPRAPQTRNPIPAGHTRKGDAPDVLACNVRKGIHRWAEPFADGDTCRCGALYLDAHPVGGAAFEVSDQ